MTSVLLSLVFLQVLTPPVIFKSSAQAHAELRDFSATIMVFGSTPGRKQQTTIDLAAKGDEVLIRMREPAHMGLDRSDRSFMLTRGLLIGYDAVANERLERNASGATRLERLADTLGSVEEVVARLLDPAQMSALIDGLQTLPGWKASLSGENLTVSRSGGAEGANLKSARFVVGVKDRLLRELWMSGDGSELKWSIRYEKPGSLALRIPADARRVTSFTVAEAPPTFASKAAESKYKAMIKAGSRLKSGTVQIESDGPSVRLVFEGSKVREGHTGFVWLFDGKTLTMDNPGQGSFYRGGTQRSLVIDQIVAAGGRLDPLSRNILLRRSPFGDWVPPGSKVAIAGSLIIDGAPSTLLRGTARDRRTTIVVRNSDNLPISVAVELLDLKGNLLNRSERMYRYSRLNESQTATEFRMAPPKGRRVMELPKISLMNGG